jgi:hypothetical protein
VKRECSECLTDDLNDKSCRSRSVTQLQLWRRSMQIGFFVLFILVPVLNIFRVDVTKAHVVLFGEVWSLVWMANRRGMVVGFDRRRAAECGRCASHCEHACPMRLKPRSIKRQMFTCTECGQCIAACEQVQENLQTHRPPLLQWLQGDCALDVSARDFGKRPNIPSDCYRR